MPGFLLCPVAKSPAPILEQLLQGLRGVPLGQHGLVLGRDIEVHERQLDFVQPALGAQQRAVDLHLRLTDPARLDLHDVDLHLRPVQCAAVGRHGVEVAAECLDLFHALAPGVVAVGTPAHDQAVEFAADADLGFIPVTLLRSPR